MPIAIIVLLAALIAIALRNTIGSAIPIWAIMLTGAVAVLLFHQITPWQALTAIEPDVMFYLLGVFLISQAAEESGYLEYLTDKIFFHAHTGKTALLIIIFILGLSSTFLMNDTIATIGVPIILQLCKKHKELIKPLLFSLAFAVTIGSTASPIGNPQNLLIAVKGDMAFPFLTFFESLAIPTIINLIITYLFIYITNKPLLNKPIEKPIPAPMGDYRTVLLVKISLAIMLLLVISKVLTSIFHLQFKINFSYIALVSALPILLSKQRWVFIRKMDWGTLCFFAGIFILMQSVWNSGFFQAHMNTLHLPITTIAIILVLSVILSQFISNVPLVALYLPLLMHQHLANSHLLALAVGSTIAGNLSILGAASNIIIIQKAEKSRMVKFCFFEFMKLGAPLTLVNVLVYACFI